MQQSSVVGRRAAERVGLNKEAGTRSSLILCQYDASHFTDVKYVMSQKGHKIGPGTQVFDL